MKQKSFYRRIVPALAGTIFFVLLGLAIFNALRQAKKDTGAIIAHDVALLAEKLQQIHKDCAILDFDYQQTRIDFLTVVQFVGSEVGAMNLAHPERWKGPYLHDNPTIQDKEYMVVKTEKGYFVTPGQDVVLPNGKRIGRDIILNERADIAALARDKNAFLLGDKLLALPLDLGFSYDPALLEFADDYD